MLSVYFPYFVSAKMKEYISSNVIDQTNNIQRYTIYYMGQIISDGNKQCSFSVFSFLDAALSQIFNKLPFITDTMLHTDNAKSKSNVFLLCGILLLNHIYNHSTGLPVNIL